MSTAQLDIDQARAEAKLRHDLRAADRAAAAQTRADRRAEKHQATEQRRAWRRERRQRRRAALAELGRRLRPAAPIALVTALAMYGQVAYAYAEIAPPWWIWPLRVVLALAIGIAFESISLTVQWHAHDSLLRGHTLTAARQRRVSYLLAIGGGVVNYSHFAGPGWSPTPAAVCFFAFSAAGPWLWGLHTRRAHQVQLSREGQLDTGGAVFSAERFRWFPIRTLLALRWSIDQGVTDPRSAWVGYNVEQRARKALRKAGKTGAPQLTEGELRSAAEAAGVPVVRTSVPTHVYRLLDAEGELLYVGVTHNLDARLGQHRRDKSWWDDVANVEARSYPSREQALAVEMHVIEHDRPIHNVAPGALADATSRLQVDSGGPVPDRRGLVDTSRLDHLVADLRAGASRPGRRYSRDEIRQMYGIGTGKARTVMKILGWGPRAIETDVDESTESTEAAQ